MNAALRLYPVLALAAAGLLAGFSAWARAHRKTPEQIEAERRARINEIGRITDGTVIDVSELPANGRGDLQLLIYQYDVAGVSYLATGDVSDPVVSFDHATHHGHVGHGGHGDCSSFDAGSGHVDAGGCHGGFDGGGHH